MAQYLSWSGCLTISGKEPTKLFYIKIIHNQTLDKIDYLGVEMF